MSLLGLVRHLTEVERNWFRRVLAAEDSKPLYYPDENKDGDFDDVEAATWRATWRSSATNSIAAAVSRPSTRTLTRSGKEYAVGGRSQSR